MEVCTDSFLINMVGNLLCTLKLKNREEVKAVYGTNVYSKTFLYTPGTGVDTSHDNYGFHVEYEPSPGDPNANPVQLPDPNFPPGVTLAGSFNDVPDLSGSLTEAKEATFSGTVVMDRATYPGSNNPNYAKQVTATISFNPGI